MMRRSGNASSQRLAWISTRGDAAAAMQPGMRVRADGFEPATVGYPGLAYRRIQLARPTDGSHTRAITTPGLR